MSVFGIGYYGNLGVNDLTVETDLFLCHRCPEIARELRARYPKALIGLRPDHGHDADQCRFDLPPAEAAVLFIRDWLLPQVSQAGIGTPDYLTGINEKFPSYPPKPTPELIREYLAALDWRLAFERFLCEAVQWGVGMPAWWRPLGYAWGSIDVGHLEAADVERAAWLFEHAWAVNAHLYLAPGRRTWLQETDGWCARRPVEVWLPELRRLGLPLRLLVGESGPYTADLVGASERVMISADIHDWLESRQDGRFQFVGSCVYGVGMFGDQEPWELMGQRGEIGFFAETRRQMFRPLIPSREENGMALKDQYPAEFAAWEAAGGVENNLRKHLLATGTLKAKAVDLRFLADEAMGADKQLQLALAGYPFPPAG